MIAPITMREFENKPQATAWLARQGFAPTPGKLAKWQQPDRDGLAATHETTAWGSVRVRIFPHAK